MVRIRSLPPRRRNLVSANPRNHPNKQMASVESYSRTARKIQGNVHVLNVRGKIGEEELNVCLSLRDSANELHATYRGGKGGKIEEFKVKTFEPETGILKTEEHSIQIMRNKK